MKNFIVSYDLNGRNPTHAQMDKHIQKLNMTYGRILETVWYIKGNTTVDALAGSLGKVLSPNDRLVVVQCGAAIFNNTLTGDTALINAWNNQRVA